MSELSTAESYLHDFHQRVVGSTTAAFASLPTTTNGVTHRSSYDLLASLIPAGPKPVRVLDVGCGDGHLLGLLAERKQPGLRLIGVDMSQGELDAAKLLLPVDVTLLRERAQHLSIKNDTIDFALSHMALMLMDDIELVFSEIRRVLNCAGMIAFVVGRSFLLGPINQAYLDTLRPIARREGAALQFGDSRMQSEDGWKALMSASFSDIRCANVDVRWRPTPSELWESLATTYDVDRLSLTGQDELRDRFFATLVNLQEGDGRVSTGWGQRLFTARSA
ncbi:Methyltransferase domain-containing protein [Burkholderia sp. D7]|nr:Methyltransferase domain-containing protein [Burkholderia sp. D7]